MRKLIFEFDTPPDTFYRIFKEYFQLVRPIGDETSSFALKRMAKFRIVEQDQQEHIKNERSLLMTLDCDFIVKCYQSFR